MMRVAVVCADSVLLQNAVRHLLRIGVAPVACPTLTELAGFAERADVVLAFSDGMDGRGLAREIAALERWRSGPALIVVSDGAFPWAPSVPRDRPALRVPHAFLEWPVEVEPSMPELPFTD